MQLTIEQVLQQGIEAHRDGRLQDAERFYQAILKSQPLHPDANHNLGVLAISANKVDQSLLFFKVALEANPKIEQFWVSYIDALIKEKHFEAAKTVILQAEKRGVIDERLNMLKTDMFQKHPSIQIHCSKKILINQKIMEPRFCQQLN